MTSEELAALPVVFSFETACRALSVGRNQGEPPGLPVTFADGEPVIVRLLTSDDDLLSAWVHTSVPTRPRPAGLLRWPRYMPAVCTDDRADEGLRPCHV